MVVEDLDMVETTSTFTLSSVVSLRRPPAHHLLFVLAVDGKPYQAARFAKQWRHQLMKEHLGIIVYASSRPHSSSNRDSD